VQRLKTVKFGSCGCKMKIDLETTPNTIRLPEDGDYIVFYYSDYKSGLSRSK
jgi:hypothetical protein